MSLLKKIDLKEFENEIKNNELTKDKYSKEAIETIYNRLDNDHYEDIVLDFNIISNEFKEYADFNNLLNKYADLKYDTLEDLLDSTTAEILSNNNIFVNEAELERREYEYER